MADACPLPGSDLWLREEPDGSFAVGVLLARGGSPPSVAHVRAPPLGHRLVAGAPMASVESEKWVGHLAAPANGVVVAVNPDVLRSPMLLADPTGGGWLFRFVADDPVALRARLLPVTASTTRGDGEGNLL